MMSALGLSSLDSHSCFSSPFFSVSHTFFTVDMDTMVDITADTEAAEVVMVELVAMAVPMLALLLLPPSKGGPTNSPNKFCQNCK